MSTHIAAKKEDVAPLVLLPGDPLRAKFIAENFLENAVCYNTVRGAFGFTGRYKGSRVSVQSTGMGAPSISIYANELFKEYGVKKAIRIGTAGAIQKDLNARDLVIALSASTDSAINPRRFNGGSYAACACFKLLRAAYQAAQNAGIEPHCGGVFTTDLFYDENCAWKIWARYGALAVEMETAELYTLAAKFGVSALSILTISDSLVTGESLESGERERGFKQMMSVGLETLIAP
ncbi:MAG: purine-nucleoside phosphorylase [Spirochaetaceae bacterium]|jgi:purine-nucleoside phosphorylase|nr:purine-nucleoside phosphorylase [Spirochaetaceae bacterium]